MPVDEMKLLRQRDLGAKAKHLREDELLNKIFEGLKAQYIREWASSDLNDKALREDKFLQIHALLDVRAQMNAICTDGETAAKFLEHEAKFKVA